MTTDRKNRSRSKSKTRKTRSSSAARRAPDPEQHGASGTEERAVEGNTTTLLERQDTDKRSNVRTTTTTTGKSRAMAATATATSNSHNRSSSGSSTSADSTRTEKTGTSGRRTGTNTNPSAAAPTKKNTQQLIVLRHAARCTYGTAKGKPGPCPIHKQCGQMKDLLEHIRVCKMVDCKVPNCASSKAFVDVIYPNNSKGSNGGSGEEPDPIELSRRSSQAVTRKAPEKLTKSSTSQAKNKEQAGLVDEDHDLELGASIDETSFDADEQQSLLEAEISRRRAKLAPKTVQPPKKEVTPSSAASVTGEIRKRAEAIMQKLTMPRSAYSVEDLTMDDSNSKWGQYVQKSTATRSRRWRIARFVCIGIGFMILLSTASLFLLYVFGGEEWDLFMQHFFNVEPPNRSSNGDFINVGTSVPVESDADTPTMAPTSFVEGLPAYTIAKLQKDHSLDSESPQTKAYDFIKKEKAYFAKALKDNGVTEAQALKAGSIYTDDQWRNRFALAALYYATTTIPSDANGTSRTNSATAISNWTEANNWLSIGVTECDWALYSCERSESLWIADNNLRGSLPEEMGMLSVVRDIAIMKNPNLKGELPSHLGDLTNTVSLNFQGNGFEGPIPSEIAGMSSLRWLYLNNNQLESTIPLELARMSQLAYLWLQDNQLSGSLDPKLFENKGFRQLQELLLHNNALTGPIPKTMNMPRLRLLSLQGNEFTGTIPSEIAQNTELRILNLHNIPGLTGSVPEELCDLLVNGKLTTITIDCDVVTCDCNCICIASEQTTEPIASSSGVNRPPLTEPTSSPVAKTQTASPSRTANTGSVTRETVPPQNEAMKATMSPSQATAVAGTVENMDLGYYSPNEAADVVTAAADFMLVLPEYTKEALLVDDSPQSMALDWLQSDANLGSYSFRRKMQRFALATIFFSTSGMDSWFDRDYWLDLETNMHECDWFQSRPTPDKPVCVQSETDSERIMTELLLWDNGLEGPLPPELSYLTSLEAIFGTKVIVWVCVLLNAILYSHLINCMDVPLPQ